MKKFLVMGGIFASLVTGAYANVEVRIINTAGGGDTGWVVCAATSCVFSGAVGNYNVALDSAIQNTGINPLLDMTYQANTLDATPGSITFEAMANGYTFNTPETKIVGNGNSNLGDTVNLASLGGNNNTICPMGVNGCTPASNGSATLTNLMGLPENLNVSAFGPGNTVNPYSLAIVLTLNNPKNAGGASGDIMLNAVPEPASVMLLGGVLLIAATGFRRRMRKV